MAVKNSVSAIPALTIDSASFNNTFQLAGTLSKPCFMLRIFNNSGVSVLISYDGTNIHDFVLSHDEAVLNFQANSQPNTSIANIAAGTKIYVSGLAASTGLVYIAGYYQSQGAS